MSDPQVAACNGPTESHRNAAAAERCPLHQSPLAAALGRAGVAGLDSPDAPSVELRHKWAKASTPDVLAVLANDPEVEVRKALAGNTRAAPDVLMSLLSDDERTVLISLATNPKLPTAGMDALRRHSDKVVRGAVLRNRAVPMDWLLAASTGGDLAEREAVALSPRTPPDVLDAMASDADERVRALLMQNQHTPEVTISRLMTDKEEHVRRVAVMACDSHLVTLGVHRDNERALMRLRALEWWTLTQDSDELVLTLTLHPNP